MPIRGQPRYNPRRRSGIGCWMNYQQAGGSEYAGPTSSIGSCNSSWTNSHYHTFSRLMNSGGPPSPCPSDHPFNSASSSLSESSSSHRSQEDDISIVTGNLHTASVTHSVWAALQWAKKGTHSQGRVFVWRVIFLCDCNLSEAWLVHVVTNRTRVIDEKRRSSSGIIPAHENLFSSFQIFFEFFVFQSKHEASFKCLVLNHFCVRFHSPCRKREII